MRYTFLVPHWLGVVAWAGLIFYISGIPRLSTGLGIWDLILRKFAHVFEFFVLTLLFLRAGNGSWPSMSVKAKAILGGLFAVLYAVSDEIHQSFVPGRGPSAIDVLIDTVGVILCILIYQFKWDAPFFKSR